MRFESCADFRAKSQVKSADYAGARSPLIDVGRSCSKTLHDEFGFTDRTQQGGTVGAMLGLRVDENGRTNVVPAREVFGQFRQQVAAMHGVAQMVVRIYDRQCGFEYRFSRATGVPNLEFAQRANVVGLESRIVLHQFHTLFRFDAGALGNRGEFGAVGTYQVRELRSGQAGRVEPAARQFFRQSAIEYGNDVGLDAGNDGRRRAGRRK